MAVPTAVTPSDLYKRMAQLSSASSAAAQGAGKTPVTPADMYRRLAALQGAKGQPTAPAAPAAPAPTAASTGPFIGAQTGNRAIGVAKADILGALQSLGQNVSQIFTQGPSSSRPPDVVSSFFRGIPEGATIGLYAPGQPARTTGSRAAELAGELLGGAAPLALGGEVVDAALGATRLAPVVARLGLIGRAAKSAAVGAGIGATAAHFAGQNPAAQGALSGLTYGLGELAGPVVGAVGRRVPYVKGAIAALDKMRAPLAGAISETHDALEPWFHEASRIRYRMGHIQQDIGKMVPQAAWKPIIDQLRGVGEAPAEMQPMAQQIRQFFDDLHAKANAAGLKIGYLQDYFPRYYREFVEGQRPAAAGKGMSPNTGRARARTLSEAEAEAKGFAGNLPAVMARYYGEISRAIANKQVVDDLRARIDPATGRKLLMAPNSKNIPSNYVSVELPQYLARALHGFAYKAPSDVAKYLKSIFSAPIGADSEWLQGYLKLKSTVTRAKMINPGFHAGNVVRALVSAGVNPVSAILRGRTYLAQDSPIVEEALRNGLNLEGTGWEVARSVDDALFNSNPGEEPPSTKVGATMQRMQNWLWNGVVRNSQVGLYAALKERLERKYAGQIASGAISPDRVGYIAASMANTILGTTRTEFLSPGARAAARWLLFAPKWAPSRMKMAAAGITGTFLKEFTPAEQAIVRKEYRQFLLRAVGYSGAMIQALNMAINGHDTSQNEPGHKFEVDITPLVGVDEQGRRQYLDIAGWAKDYLRAPSGPSNYLFYKLSPPISETLNDIVPPRFGVGARTAAQKLYGAAAMFAPAVRDFPTADSIKNQLLGTLGLGVIPGPKPR